jgi:hypothetical protein
MVKTQIAEALRERFADVAGRGRIIGQALKVRADLAATRRRLRTTFAELGEEVYRRIKDQQLEADGALGTLEGRIDGYKAEVRSREQELSDIMRNGFRGQGADNGGGGEHDDGGSDDRGGSWRAS